MAQKHNCTMSTEKLPLKFVVPADAPFVVAKADTASTGVAYGVFAKKLAAVPKWWYLERVPCCGLTKASFMWWSNLICFVFHLGLALVTVFVSTADGRSFATPTLAVYVTNLTWIPNSTDALVPTFQKADTPLYLSTMTAMFFGLSALAHGLIVGFNWRQAFAAENDNWKVITYWTGWYYKWCARIR